MIWDGAAAVAQAGQLPDTGFFIATNSFPLNTVVDITNLDNGKTARVMVISGLDTPGLLAIVSARTAETIDLSFRTIGRIRLSQSDTPAPARAPIQADRAISTDRLFSAYVPETEWANDLPVIIDLPEPAQTAASVIVATPSLVPPPPVQETASGRIELTLTPARVITPTEDTLVIPDEYIIAGIAPSEPVYITDIPMPVLSIDESRIIMSFEEKAAAAALAAEIPGPYSELFIDETFVIATLDTRPDNPDSLSPQEHRPADILLCSLHIPESVLIADAPLIPDAPELALFSVPVITATELGKYYIQLGAYGNTELVEQEISRISNSYPLQIQTTGTSESPMYRILLGPLNQGESGALLQRFRSLGYADAFIRRN
jgi:hypothetical protein